MVWRVAYSLDVLYAEVNAAAPDRSKASDGSIGDADHASRSSDHNPWVTRDGVGIVRARDFTHDPAHGCDAGKLAEAIRRLGIHGHPALGQGAYVIWNRRIASATADGQPWDWEPYGGDNPHTAHCHVSVALAASGYDSRRPWGVMATTDWIDMASKQEVEEAVDKPWMETSSTLNADGTRSEKTVRQLLVLAADRSYKAARDGAAGLAIARATAEAQGLTKAQLDRIEADVDELAKANEEETPA